MVNLRITDDLRCRHRKSRIPFLPNHKNGNRCMHLDLVDLIHFLLGVLRGLRNRITLKPLESHL